jgi:GNAT superfamily N-acetyltransferase
VPEQGRPESSDGHSIELVTEADLPDLLPLMRAYCDFYEAAPADEQLLALARTLLADPEQEGLQLIARDGEGRAVGFATIFWSWSTTSARRVGVMNDLYVLPSARGQGLADSLIAACAERCALRGAASLEWQTAPSNLRAQAVYDRVGGKREEWLNYTLEVTPEPWAVGEG